MVHHEYSLQQAILIATIPVLVVASIALLFATSLEGEKALLPSSGSGSMEPNTVGMQITSVENLALR